MSWSRRLLILAVALAPTVWVAVDSGSTSDVVTVGAVAFSPDSRALATICCRRSPQPHAELWVWDVLSGRERLDHREDRPRWPLAAAWIWAAAWGAIALFSRRPKANGDGRDISPAGPAREMAR